MSYTPAFVDVSSFASYCIKTAAVRECTGWLVAWEILQAKEREVAELRLEERGAKMAATDALKLCETLERQLNATRNLLKMTREATIEECAKVCEETAQLQSEMAKSATEESMVTYRKARAWDAMTCATKIRALKGKP